MYFTLLFTAAIAALPSLAAPVEKSMMAPAAVQWTVESFKRTCDTADTACVYTYGLDTHSGSVTPFKYTVKGSPASRTSYSNVMSGPYTASSNWSGQFGAGNGFQTIAITNGKRIIYAAYRDIQLPNGKTVTPDQSYTPQNLP